MHFSFFKPKLARIAFNMRPVNGPWGGSSAFVTQLSALLRHRGYDISYSLEGDIDLIILVDPRLGEAKPFGLKEIIEYKIARPDTVVMHRINECDQRKSTRFMDDLLKEANSISDYTIFISKWLLDYHAARWFDVSRPHSVIYNGADPAIFHPIGSSSYEASGTFRLVTHHWSNHRLKGFDIYHAVDRLIADGSLPDVELQVIGKWPEDICWNSAVTTPPLSGHRLAQKLRSCHAYLTASLWEPCGMHHVEGAQCGLPLIYHTDGGGIVEAGQQYGIGFHENVKEAILEMKYKYTEYREMVLSAMPSGDVMNIHSANIVQRLLCK